MALATAVCGVLGLAEPVASAATAGAGTWSLAEMTVSPGDVSSKGLACPAPGTCIALGTTGFLGHVFANAAVYRHGAWSSAQSLPPGTDGQDVFPQGVTCPTTTYCVAYGPNRLYEWRGATWTLSEIERPPGTFVVDVSDGTCFAPDDCLFVGSTEGFGVTRPMILRVEDGVQTLEQVQDLPGTVGYRALSCSGPTTCVAVGDVDGALLFGTAWNGSTRRSRVLPVPADADPGRSPQGTEQLACTAWMLCTAVESYQTATGAPRVMAVTFSSGRWSVAQLPAPEGLRPRGVSVGSVQCLPQGRCLAPVTYEGVDGTHQSVEVTTLWSRSAQAWSSTTPDHPWGAFSCPHVGGCAVGTASSVGHESDQGWTFVPLQLPPGASGRVSEPVLRCPSNRWCMAVYSYDDVAHLSGGTFSQVYRG